MCNVGVVCLGVWSDCGLRGVMQQLMLPSSTDEAAVVQQAQQLGYSGEAAVISSLHQLTPVNTQIVDRVIDQLPQNTVSLLHSYIEHYKRYSRFNATIKVLPLSA